MNIPQLQIQTTPGRLGLQTDKPVQQIEQPRATQDIEQPAAILEMSTTRPQLSLDTTENRADLDLKSALRRSSENARYGLQQVTEGTGRRAQEGHQLMQIENGGNAIANIAKQVGDRSNSQIGIRFVGDRSKIHTDIISGSLTINATPQKPIINAQVNKPIYTYTPGKVTGTMEQYPSIQIDWKG
ncbi:hypothetical protein NCCP2716_19010 [Sporosarcina sp. NCCP-2716]|uniref:DUF6470 family protein n=1 Tax=Sporosarcina sp. NCCP-2716 TaxID=2943679 RepID=UPI00203B314D|nr:DUF6470 family protein [Sporosarcina sp. NCCP-2716]GKV69403.1 hypothetical protein NCCP2716_19010 [Sporosarcina sp. NCCP-2716]